MENIRESIDKMFNEINKNSTNNGSKEGIDELVNNQNNKVREEYRKELIEKIEEIKGYGIKIEYDENTPIEELENIINDVQF